MYFDRWCNSREVGTELQKLRQVILIEEFKRCVCNWQECVGRPGISVSKPFYQNQYGFTLVTSPCTFFSYRPITSSHNDIKTYLDEQKVENLQKSSNLY